MENRRLFLKKSATAAIMLSTPGLYGCINIGTVRAVGRMKPTPVP